MSTKRKRDNKVWMVTVTETEDMYQLPGGHQCHTKVKLFEHFSDAVNFQSAECRRLLLNHTLSLIDDVRRYQHLQLGPLIKEMLCGAELLDDWAIKTEQIVNDLKQDQINGLYEESREGNERMMSYIVIKGKTVNPSQV